MWQVWRYLFGWDYIYWEGRLTSGVSRVHYNGDGVIFYIRDSCHYSKSVVEIQKSGDCFWLTCSPSKYGITEGSSDDN